MNVGKPKELVHGRL